MGKHITLNLSSLNKKHASFKSTETVKALVKRGYDQPLEEVDVPVASMHIDADTWSEAGRPNEIQVELG